MTADKLSVFKIIGGVGLIYLFVYSFNNIAFQYFQSSDGNRVFERYMHAFYDLGSGPTRGPVRYGPDSHNTI